ncbi:hypothetical protein L3Q82_005290 [Scortum barcoo]|uniref:Uncharacterized protein n=1 Tax=Scortum barcoo TaxID=214431 RepID=A0ACB8V9T0_9TELE|nr:hypothetical protein L3Q82_005290 [Scortum barcoo]
MSRSIHQRHVAPQTVQELADALVQVWEEIPQETIRHLIRSMPRLHGLRSAGMLTSMSLNGEPRRSQYVTALNSCCVVEAALEEFKGFTLRTSNENYSHKGIPLPPFTESVFESLNSNSTHPLRHFCENYSNNKGWQGALREAGGGGDVILSGWVVHGNEAGIRTLAPVSRSADGCRHIPLDPGGRERGAVLCLRPERRSPDQTDDALPCLGDFHAANRQRYQLPP